MISIRLSIFCVMSVLAAAELPARANAAVQLYVSATGDGGAGDGSIARPFVLTAGEEYALNRLIRQYSGSQQEIDIIFEDGIYQDVRLKLIRQGTDSSSVYSPDSIQQRECAAGDYYAACTCNRSNQNCRVVAGDFTFGSSETPLLVLSAQDTGAAIFDGSDLQANNAVQDGTAAVIAGSSYGVVPSAISALQSQPMSDVVLSGLVFQNYRNGVLLSYVKGVMIENCVFSNIGSNAGATVAASNYGTSAIGIQNDSELMLFADNSISNARNVAGTATADQPLPSLMHSIYLEDSRDAVFLANHVSGSSGPMIKFSYYAGSTTSAAFPSGAAYRRNFFLDNSFDMSAVEAGGVTLPVFTGEQSFIEDNAVVATTSGTSAPSSGEIVLDNSFENALDASDAVYVSMLRQEIPSRLDAPSYPEWLFAGNPVDDVQSRMLSVFRYRDSAIDTTTIETGDTAIQAARTTRLLDADQSDVLTASAVLQRINALLQGPLASTDTSEDNAVLELITQAVNVQSGAD